nr:hypothetical protein [Tanacetum cinerariifolium]
MMTQLAEKGMSLDKTPVVGDDEYEENDDEEMEVLDEDENENENEDEEINDGDASVNSVLVRVWKNDIGFVGDIYANMKYVINIWDGLYATVVEKRL